MEHLIITSTLEVDYFETYFLGLSMEEFLEERENTSFSSDP